MDLDGQLPRGGEDQCPDPAARTSHEAVEKRQHKGRCLSGACLGQSQDIAPVHDVRNGLFLDGSWRGVSLLDDCSSDVRVKIELIECH